jgi:hypothetical protein
MDFQNICLTGTLLNEMCLDQHLFPDSFTIICSDCVSSTKYKGGGVLTAVLSRASTFKCRYELQFYHEPIWVKISTQSSHSLLNGNDYPHPDTKQDVISKCFCSLEKNLDTKNKCSFDWGFNVQCAMFLSLEEESAPITLSFLFKIKWCCKSHLNVPLRSYEVHSDLQLFWPVFCNFIHVGIFFAEVGVVKPNSCHPHIVIKIPLDLHIFTLHVNVSIPNVNMH